MSAKQKIGAGPAPSNINLDIIVCLIRNSTQTVVKNIIVESMLENKIIKLYLTFRKV